MAYLAYAVRHLQKSMEDHVLEWLQGRGWMTAASVPFGASVTRFQRGAMEESELTSVSGNLVAVSFGGEPDDDPQELGGGLMMVAHAMFVDCLGEKEAIALALASDVKDLLAGRAPMTTRYPTLYDYTGDPRTPVVGYGLELTDVVRVEGNPSVRRNWHVVKATIEMTYVSEDDGS